MALIHEKSCQCTSSQLDLFTVPPTQTSIVSGTWDAYHPISNLLEGSPIEFHIAGTPEEYVDLAQTKLHIKAKITNGDGTNLADGAQVGPTNLFLQSMFSQCEVMLNERLVSPASTNYAYRAYLETLLNYGKEAKESQFTASMFHKDTAGRMDAQDPTANDADANLGLKKRYAASSRSKIIDMAGPIHADIFQQDRMLLPSVDIKVKMTPSKAGFCLMCPDVDGDYKVVITHAALLVRRVRVNPSVALGHARALEKAHAVYPLTRSEIKVFSVPQGTMSISKDNLFLGQLPQRLVIACVDADSFNGVLNKSPFNFKHRNLNFLSLTLDGQQIPSTKPLTPKFALTNGQACTQAYQTLFSGLNKMYKDTGNSISLEEFSQGYTSYCFDLSPDLNVEDHMNLLRKGNLRLEMRLQNALPQTAMVLMYAEFQNIFEIDRSRNVIFDYSI